uniref:Cysteinyl leukotriene receptor 3 n=1 Tax=Eptatretus burgeri TaxID=7764 RepID=A0A8C4Q0H9_EPTBU
MLGRHRQGRPVCQGKLRPRVGQTGRGGASVAAGTWLKAKQYGVERGVGVVDAAVRGSAAPHPHRSPLFLLSCDVPCLYILHRCRVERRWWTTCSQRQSVREQPVRAAWKSEVLGMDATIAASGLSSMMNADVNGSSDPLLSCQIDYGFKYTVYTVIYSLIFILGFPSNAVALYMFFFHVRDRTSNNIYLQNLAAADMLFILLLPLRISYYSRGGDWIFGDLICRLSIYSLYVDLYCSIFFLTGLSVVRYLAIVHPALNYRKDRSCLFRSICVSIWIFVGLLTLPFLFSGQHKSGERTLCFDPKGTKQFGMALAMSYVALCIGFLLPFFIILFCYVSITLTLIQRPVMGTIGKRRTQTRKAIGMIATVLLVFLFCFLPYHIVTTLHLQTIISGPLKCSTRHRLLVAAVVTRCMLVCNSCLDPLIYFFSAEKFQERLRHIWQHRSFSTKSTSKGSDSDECLRRNTLRQKTEPSEKDKCQPNVAQTADVSPENKCDQQLLH